MAAFLAQAGHESGQLRNLVENLNYSADARAGELAKAYDRARIAGQACEASYTALTK
ncbi:hypothetical protein D3C80_2222390 [compost metagenome]